MGYTAEFNEAAANGATQQPTIEREIPGSTVSHERYEQWFSLDMGAAGSAVSETDADLEYTGESLAMMLGGVNERLLGAGYNADFSASQMNPEHPDNIDLVNGGNPELFAKHAGQVAHAYTAEIGIGVLLNRAGLVPSDSAWMFETDLTDTNIGKFLAHAAKNLGENKFDDAGGNRFSYDTNDCIVFANALKTIDTINSSPDFSAQALQGADTNTLAQMAKDASEQYGLTDEQMLAVYEVMDPRGNPTPEQQEYVREEIAPLFEKYGVEIVAPAPANEIAPTVAPTSPAMGTP